MKVVAWLSFCEHTRTSWQEICNVQGRQILMTPLLDTIEFVSKSWPNWQNRKIPTMTIQSVCSFLDTGQNYSCFIVRIAILQHRRCASESVARSYSFFQLLIYWKSTAFLLEINYHYRNFEIVSIS